MTALCIIFLILEAAMLVFLVGKIRRCKQISLKDTVIYPFLLLVSALVLGTAHAKYAQAEKWFESITYAFSEAFDIIKLSIDTSFAQILRDNDIFMLFDYLLLYAISALALFSLSLSLVKTLVKNVMRIKLFNREIDYIFGLNEDAKAYVDNLTPEQKKNTCVVLKYAETRNYNAEKLYLDEKGIKYYVAAFSSEKEFKKTVARFTSRKNRKYYLLGFFDCDREIYEFVTNAQNYLREKDLYGKNVQFIVSATGRQAPFVKELIKGNPNTETVNSKGKKVKLTDESRGNIRVFDKCEILAYDFIMHDNFAKYFPAKLLNGNGTICDCDVNLYVLGFGKVNQALLKDILIQTQFVTVKGKRLAPLRMNVEIYDRGKKLENINLAYGLMKYDKSNYNAENYFELPEGYASKIHYNYETDTGEVNFINTIYDGIKERGAKKPQVNYFVVALGNDYANSLVAKRLKDSFELLGENCHNVFFVRSRQSMELPCAGSGFIYFGGDKKVLTYENVVADAVFRTAKTESCIYEGRTVTDENIALEWSTLSQMKQASNLYSVASIPFKLSLLGFDLNVTEEEYFAKYDPNGERSNYVYSEKLASPAEEFSARDVLAFSEHERWTAFELSCGAVPMKIKNSLTTDGKTAKFSNKSANEIYHLCITTARGLISYHDYVEGLNKKYGLEETADVIQYDYDLMDNVMQHLENLKRQKH